jgi:hypothetical protein
MVFIFNGYIEDYWFDKNIVDCSKKNNENTQEVKPKKKLINNKLKKQNINYNKNSENIQNDKNYELYKKLNN